MAAAMNAMLTKYLKDFSVPETTALVESDLLSSLAIIPYRPATRPAGRTG